MRRRCVMANLLAVAGSAPVGRVAAQDRTLLRVVVPYAAGGVSDVMARLLAESVRRHLGRTVIVDNRPGAAALIATRYVQLAPPDGDTLLFQNVGFVTLPMLSTAASYDPVTDFAAVAMTGIGAVFLMVTESIPARNTAEFIAYARDHPGLECANSGVNSIGHMAALLLEKRAEIQLIHVPYKGSAETTRALLSGEARMQVSVTTEALNPHIASGKIRVLGVGTRNRSRLAPQVPPIGDTVPGYAIDGWYGMLAPAHTPLDRREAISAAMARALAEPAIRERFAALYVEARHSGPTAFAATIAESRTSFQSIVRDLQLTPS